MSKHNVEGDKNTILNKLDSVGMVGSSAHEQMKMGIIVRCTEDVEKSILNLTNSIDKNSKSSDLLSKKILCLNIILTIATVVASIVSVITFIYN